MAVALVTSLIGGLVDVAGGGVIGTGFAVGFVAGCLLGAVLVRRRDLRVVVVMGPLVCAAALVVAEVLGGAAGSLFATVAQAGSALIQNFPTMFVGTGVAVVTALLRGRRARVSALDRTGVAGSAPREGGGGW